jgi:hypothetical protein
MNSYIVTVRIAKNPAHDPRNKLSGMCPIDQTRCTDTTGEHHSFLHDSIFEPEEIVSFWTRNGFHVTRVEQATRLIVDGENRPEIKRAESIVIGGPGAVFHGPVVGKSVGGS